MSAPTPKTKPAAKLLIAAGYLAPGCRHDLPMILEELKPTLRRVLRYFEIPLADAEDLVQTIALQACREWSKIRWPAAWFVGNLRRRCIQYHRARRLEIRREVSLGETYDESEFGEPSVPIPTAPSPAEQVELRVDLQRLLRRLSAKQRLLLAARFRLGMVDHEAATLAGVAPASARKLTSRAMARLRRFARSPAATTAAGLASMRAGRHARPRDEFDS
jgi:RNA polymerase sigma factor (sigma-70 family)